MLRSCSSESPASPAITSFLARRASSLSNTPSRLCSRAMSASRTLIRSFSSTTSARSCFSSRKFKRCCTPRMVKAPLPLTWMLAGSTSSGNPAKTKRGRALQQFGLAAARHFGPAEEDLDGTDGGGDGLFLGPGGGGEQETQGGEECTHGGRSGGPVGTGCNSDAEGWIIA